MDEYAAHASMVIHTSREKANVDSHTQIHTFGAEGDTIESIESEPKQKTSERLPDSACRGPESQNHTRKLGHTHTPVQN